MILFHAPGPCADPAAAPGSHLWPGQPSGGPAAPGRPLGGGSGPSGARPAPPAELARAARCERCGARLQPPAAAGGAALRGVCKVGALLAQQAEEGVAVKLKAASLCSVWVFSMRFGWVFGWEVQQACCLCGRATRRAAGGGPGDRQMLRCRRRACAGRPAQLLPLFYCHCHVEMWCRRSSSGHAGYNNLVAVPGRQSVTSSWALTKDTAQQAQEYMLRRCSSKGKGCCGRQLAKALIPKHTPVARAQHIVQPGEFGRAVRGDNSFAAKEHPIGHTCSYPRPPPPG